MAHRHIFAECHCCYRHVWHLELRILRALQAVPETRNSSREALTSAGDAREDLVGSWRPILVSVLMYGQAQGRDRRSHKLAGLIYTMLTKGKEYTDQSQNCFEGAIASACCKRRR